MTRDIIVRRRRRRKDRADFFRAVVLERHTHIIMTTPCCLVCGSAMLVRAFVHFKFVGVASRAGFIDGVNSFF